MLDSQRQRRWDPFQELQREMDRLLGNLSPIQSSRAATRYPALNLYDAGDRFLLWVQLPGILASDIDLTITGETLTLCGERRRSEGMKDDNYRRQERPMGRWSRTITLPDRIDSVQVEATFSHGILTVTLPKSENARPRQIAVSTVAAAV
jgi:HSP20 family protein